MRRLSHRIAGLIVGEPGSGKTVYEKWWTDKVVRQVQAIDSTFIYDRLAEPIWDDTGPCVSSPAEYREAIENAGGRMPRRVVFRCGLEPEKYV